MLEECFGPNGGQLFHLRGISHLKKELLQAMIDNDSISLSGHREEECFPGTNIEIFIKPTRIAGERIDAFPGHPTLLIRCKLGGDGYSAPLDEEDCVLFLVKSKPNEKCPNHQRNRDFYYFVLATGNVPCLVKSPKDEYHISRIMDDS